MITSYYIISCALYLHTPLTHKTFQCKHVMTALNLADKRCRPNAVLLFLHRLQYRPSIKMTKEQPILLVWKRLSYLLHHMMRG